MIEVRKCIDHSCGKSHRLLPDIMIPYKHYDADLIEAIIDSRTDDNDDALLDGPSPCTMERWRQWGEYLETEAVKLLCPSADHIPALSESIFEFGGSQLHNFKKRLVAGWLPAIIHLLYKSTG